MPLVYPPLELSRHQEPTTEVKQQTRAAVGRRMAELTALAQRRNLFLPIEIMGMIFDYYVHLYNQLPEKLLLVCRTWHVLALSQPTLWTNLDPFRQFNLTIIRPWAGTFLQSRIARSNPAPLKVDFARLRSDMRPSVVRKVAAIPTFLSRIQELVINRELDLDFIAGDQPMLKSLTISNCHPWDKVTEKLTGKILATLCLLWTDRAPTLPNSLLQRLQTLNVTLPNNARHSEGLHEYWTMIQRCTTLRTLHIHETHGNAAALFHPSVQHLSLVYPNYECPVYALEEVRMPRLQHVVIDTLCPNALMQLKLVETPVKSLHFKCRAPIWNIDTAVDISWVDSAVHFLRSSPVFEKLETSIPSNLVSGLIEAFEKDTGLCTGLNVFLVNNPMGMEYVGWDGRRDIEAKFAPLRGRAATFINMRKSSTLTHSFSHILQK